MRSVDKVAVRRPQQGPLFSLMVVSDGTLGVAYRGNPDQNHEKRSRWYNRA